jgi:hypothetical protein
VEAVLLLNQLQCKEKSWTYLSPVALTTHADLRTTTNKMVL